MQEHELGHLGRERLLPEEQSPPGCCVVAGEEGTPLCLLILCVRDYRGDTFGLGEEHLHKVWQEVSRSKPRLTNLGKCISNLTKPGSKNLTQMWRQTRLILLGR